MPRRNNKDFDFAIHVDPSCLSEPMDEKRLSNMNEEIISWDEAHANLEMESDKVGRREHSGDDIDLLTAELLAGLQATESANDEHDSVVDDVSAAGDTSNLDDMASQRDDASVAEDHEQAHEDSSVITPTQDDAEDGATDASESRRESAVSATTDTSRRASGRTEALIHAAARDIVAHIQHGDRESLQSLAIPEDESFVSDAPGARLQSDVPFPTVEDYDTSADNSHIEEESHIGDDSYISEDNQVANESLVSEDNHTIDNSHISEEDDHVSLDNDPVDDPTAADDAGDSSSHHENEDDVFSDHSPRSSVGSTSENEQRKRDDALQQMMRSPRTSDVSQYNHDDDEDNFVPTVRGTPRPPFRSPSSVKAIQMSSPPASVFGSPRSSRRTPMPTVSRLGSPMSAQFSPKKTPPRFKRNTPPLVLLHATLLPLRWAWGDVMDTAHKEELSQDGKTLREAWRQLQDRVGDTVLERGILLPHPQNDYEVLEERLLEALELPMRRRARILECGHYLGAANEMTMTEDMDSEDDEYDYEEAKSPRASTERKTHWCSTCRSEIRFDSLGIGKVFRVKIYASNGLMKAGAWEACWKEMERVDVELEPLVEPAVQEELGRLAVEQERALERAMELDAELEAEADRNEQEDLFMEEHDRSMLPPSPVPEIKIDSSPVFDDRRRRDEERLREIYGHPPPTAPETAPEPATEPQESSYIPQGTPASPSAEAFERREGRRQAYKSASLPELILEAFGVLMQDRKNVVIVLLSVLIMGLAVRGGQTEQRRDPIVGAGVPTVTVTQAVQEVEPLSTMSAENVEVTEAAASDPCVSVSVAEVSSVSSANQNSETSVSETVLRIVETITETAVETATIRVTATETYTEVETEAVEPDVIEAVKAFASQVSYPESEDTLSSDDEVAASQQTEAAEMDDEIEVDEKTEREL